jgi:hypothetical protein
MANTRDRLMKSVKYYIDDWARRLEEVGGPGVGGTELAFRPQLTSPVGTHDEYVRSALETSIPATWEEAAWCYVYGRFSACIVLAAVLLEIALKYELLKRGLPTSLTLGRIIQRASDANILPINLISKANSVNRRRNDIVHANIQKDRPESLLHHTGDEHEIEPIKDLSRNITKDGWLTGDGETIVISFGAAGPTYSRVHAFKLAARASLDDVKDILKFLYPLEPSPAG